MDVVSGPEFFVRTGRTNFILGASCGWLNKQPTRLRETNPSFGRLVVGRGNWQRAKISTCLLPEKSQQPDVVF